VIAAQSQGASTVGGRVVAFFFMPPEAHPHSLIALSLPFELIVRLAWV